ncbi:MAG: rubrerythrin [Ignavibacteria bacterium GWA2_35_9]|nr:MAG: rubrerythrin [Ignavibacteria bacterium GWA2_35_9]OGU46305.1 MAG: rubrerythrin [Ignavibacteria bacterium GWB2_36_8]OGU51571.1 MAG: rubrerythrin [Ignavibacteria bacterium GWC2_36_12]OGU99374.1 MAG: rubrerythrin [Ignavibacteria bacterium RIFOXYA2_FULL_37_17]OGV05726.1 MAG: rubrerythrin [Ignavibacteria bacterium RIFOXYB2_FULL_36_7]
MTNKKQIIENLTKSYWMEVETVINYISNSVNLDGVRAEEIKKSLATDVAEEITHAQRLAKRIKELGGTVPGSLKFSAVQRGLQTLEDTTDVVSVIEGVIDAEAGAIKQYNKIIKLCDGVDYVTQDLCVQLLGMEESHLIEFRGFLKEYKK